MYKILFCPDSKTNLFIKKCFTEDDVQEEEEENFITLPSLKSRPLSPVLYDDSEVYTVKPSMAEKQSYLSAGSFSHQEAVKDTFYYENEYDRYDVEFGLEHTRPYTYAYKRQNRFRIESKNDDYMDESDSLYRPYYYANKPSKRGAKTKRYELPSQIPTRPSVKRGRGRPRKYFPDDMAIMPQPMSTPTTYEKPLDQLIRECDAFTKKLLPHWNPHPVIQNFSEISLPCLSRDSLPEYPATFLLRSQGDDDGNSHGFSPNSDISFITGTKPQLANLTNLSQLHQTSVLVPLLNEDDAQVYVDKYRIQLALHNYEKMYGTSPGFKRMAAMYNERKIRKAQASNNTSSYYQRSMGYRTNPSGVMDNRPKMVYSERNREMKNMSMFSNQNAYQQFPLHQQQLLQQHPSTMTADGMAAPIIVSSQHQQQSQFNFIQPNSQYVIQNTPDGNILLLQPGLTDDKSDNTGISFGNVTTSITSENPSSILINHESSITGAKVDEQQQTFLFSGSDGVLKDDDPNSTTTFPAGTFLEDPSTGQVYFIPQAQPDDASLLANNESQPEMESTHQILEHITKSTEKMQATSAPSLVDATVGEALEGGVGVETSISLTHSTDAYSDPAKTTCVTDVSVDSLLMQVSEGTNLQDFVVSSGNGDGSCVVGGSGGSSDIITSISIPVSNADEEQNGVEASTGQHYYYDASTNSLIPANIDSTTEGNANSIPLSLLVSDDGMSSTSGIISSSDLPQSESQQPVYYILPAQNDQ